MRVLFGVVVCVLISSRRIASVTGENSSSTISSSSPFSTGLLSSSPYATVVRNLTSSPSYTTTTERYIGCTDPQPPEIISIIVTKVSAKTTWNTTQTDIRCIPIKLDAICVATEENNHWGWSWVHKLSVTNITLSGYDAIFDLHIENLSEFTNYTCNVTLEFDATENIEVTPIEFQTKEEVPSQPKFVALTDVTATSFVVSWQPPAKNPGLLKGYHLEIFDLGAKYFIPHGCDRNTSNFTVSTLEKRYLFLEASPYHEYRVEVWVENSAGNGPTTTDFVTSKSTASPEPEDVHIDSLLLNWERNQITGNFTWKVPCQTNGPISVFYITLEGYYTVNPSIQDFRTFNVNAIDQDEYLTTIHEIRPASEYTFTIRADGATDIGFSTSYRFLTEDNVPGSPIIQEITDVGENYLVIYWSEPELNAGNITEYEVNVTSLNPLYDYDQTRCSIEESQYSTRLLGHIGSYNFTEGLPFYKYHISVTAFTSKGPGEPSIVIAETTPSVPDKPADFDFLLKDDNVTGVLSWKAPCKINGPMTNFTVYVTGTYTDDRSIIAEPYEKTIKYINVSHIYTLEIELKEAFNYKAAVWIPSDFQLSETVSKNLTTPDGYPGAPNNIALSKVDSNSFTIEWEPPTPGAGTIRWYQIKVTPVGPLYYTECLINDSITLYEVEGNGTRSYMFNNGLPFYNYSISLQANTTRGYGDIRKTYLVTNQSVPDNVELGVPIIRGPTNEKYDANVTIPFEKPCFLNGPLQYFELDITGRRHNFEDDIMEPQKSLSNVFYRHLKPDYDYIYTITTHNQHYSNTSLVSTFRSPSGVPDFSIKSSDFEIDTGSEGASIVLRKEYFDEANGDIRYLAIILTDKNITGGSFEIWDGLEWPSMNIADTELYIQLTDNYWNPFQDQDNFTFEIGNEIKCGEGCSISLEKNREYFLIIRLFTKNFYRNSPTLLFTIDDISRLGVILGVIFGLLVAAVVGIAGFFAWRKNMLKLPPLFLHPRKSSCGSSTYNTAFSSQKFPQYCKNLENNPEKLTEQYTLLAERTKEVIRMHTTHYAELTENRRKNRYTNILPYDETRVKLLIDEDDEIGSDYINASYIKGYSGKVEYIATQGPLPTTCRDFWKMVIQENVSIIVMVTQFIEQNKEKCYKYFPNNHESMIVGEDIEVRCSMELHFGTYCVRTIQVRKDVNQVTVTHMQYLDWPDFNVPKGTETMLQFCCQLRDRLNIEGGCVIVHCSAGVGRTGTLIATDILLQNVNAGKNIDIFNTVLELRKQRTNMVQTQKQYMYIYNLVKDFLEHSQTSGFNENLEHVYENVSVLKMKQDDDNLIAKEKQTESQF